MYALTYHATNPELRALPIRLAAPALARLADAHDASNAGVHDVAARARYSDEVLTATIAAGGYGIAGGVHPRQAEHLMRLPDAAARAAAMDEAGTRQNLQGGVLSSVLAGVVSDVLSGSPRATWARDAAARHREAERALNDALRARGHTGERVILYPAEMRRS